MKTNQAKVDAHLEERRARIEASKPAPFIGPELPPEPKAVHKFEAAGLGKAPFRFVRYENKTYQACQGAPIQPGGTCDYCGTGISGFYWINSADGREFKVGCDCVMKTGDAGLKLIVNRKKASLARERKAIRETEKRAEQHKRILAENPGLESALSVNHRIIKDIASRFTTWGSISSAQIALVMKLAKEASTPKPEEVKVPAPAGRQCFSGVVVSLKEHYGFRGETVKKIVVKVATPDGIWLAWGTCPRGSHANIGDTIELTGTLTRSDRDAHFAFFKRPTGAKIVSKKGVST